MRATRVLHAADQEPFPAPEPDPGHHHRQPEGRRRQDDVHGEPRGGAGALRAADPGHRPRPAGQREHRPRASSTPSGTPSVYDALVGDSSLAEVVHPTTASPKLLCVPGDDRPGRRRDRAGLRRRPRAPAAPGDRGLRPRPPAGAAAALRAHRLPAVPRAAHAERAGRRRRGAHPHPVRVLRARGAGPAAQQHRPGARSTSTRASPSARSC